VILLATVSGVLLFMATDPKVPVETAHTDQVINRYDAIGDSITLGEAFSFTVGPSGLPRKSVVTFQGWPGLLGHMLSGFSIAPIEVTNYGHRGDRTGEFLEQHLPGILIGELGSKRALLLLGTNDTNDFQPTPSGIDCSGTACDQTYRNQMKSVIQGLQDAGRETIFVGLLPPVWGSSLDMPYSDPLDLSVASRNRRIVEYNEIIVRDLFSMPGVVAGPDLFACFLTPTVNRYSLFEDTLHPNALGRVFMAALWRDAVTGASASRPLETCPAPVYILESLNPYLHGHKQDLLQEGDRYYSDAAFTLTNIPDELANGIWVTQGIADNGNRDKSFLTFDAGQSPVSVYVAYDPAGDPPVSSSHVFDKVTLSSDLSVSDPAVETFRIMRATNVSGMVSIGGNQSAAAAAPQQAYVVIVVP